MYDLIIIGAGPAGLTAALYALRANAKVLVIEAKTYGGQIINASKIENYPGIKEISGFEYATNLYEQVKALNCEFKFEKVTCIERDMTVVTDKDQYRAKSIIIATGTEKRPLNLPNEKQFLGHGLSYCATCDGNFYRGKKVAVVGGGNTALEDAIYLSSIASKVYLIHRRNHFRGEERYVEEIEQKENIELLMNSEITKLMGEEKLTCLEVQNADGSTIDLEVDGLFVAIGQEPNNDIFKNIIELDEDGYVKSHDEVCTSVEGIYVAGDARTKDLRQLTTAVADGAIAATMAMKERR